MRIANRLALILCSLLSVSFHTVGAQNIVPNPGFEEYDECPSFVGSLYPLNCIPWQRANYSSPDYFHECATYNAVSVPDNFPGFEYAHMGDGYTGAYYYADGGTLREYIRAPLLEPMEAGYTYHVSFWVSLGDQDFCGITRVGAHFAVNPPDLDASGLLSLSPQVESSLGFISDTSDWVLISGCFIAEGGEQWIIIGNFYPDSQTPVDTNCTEIYKQTYYYLDDVSVEKGPLPEPLEIELGEPVVACESYLIDPGIQGVSYHWENGSDDPTLLVTESGTYSLTITAGCQEGVDSIEVNIHGVESVEIGPEAVEICQGDEYAISLDPETGTYTWQDGSVTSEYTVTIPGLYQVTLDDGCELTTDEVFVDVLTVPDGFTLGEDVFLCEGDEIEFDFNPALGNFLWQNNSTSPFFVITEAGSYSLTISNMCGEVSDQLEVLPIGLPDVFIGPNQYHMCEGDEYQIILDADIGSFLWQDGSTAPFYTIAGAGQYSVTVTNQCGSSNQSVVVDIIEAPLVELGADLTLCTAQVPYVISAPPIPDVTYLWQDGTTSSQLNITGSGLYAVTVSNECFSAVDQINISVQDSALNVTLPVDQVLCEGQTFVLSANGLDGDYLWQDMSTADTFLVSSPGTYTLAVSNLCGADADTVVIDYLETLTPPQLGPDVTLCPGDSLVLYASVDNVNYTWQDLSFADSLIVTGAGTYFLQISNMCSVASDTVIVSVDATPPMVELPQDFSLCSEKDTVIDAGLSGVEYLWNDGSQLSSLTISDAGNYSLTVSNSCGMDADTIVIYDAGEAPTVELESSVSVCPGEIVVLSPVATHVQNWLWFDGSTSSTYEASLAGPVSVAVSNVCGIAYDTIEIILLSDIPTLDLGADTSICPGEIIELNISHADVGVLWNNGSTDNSMDIDTSGIIYATIYNACGSSTDSIFINLVPSIPSLDLGEDQSLCPGETITLSPGIINVDYLWQDGSSSTAYNVTSPETIILTISNACGSASDTINVIEDNDGPDVDLGEDITGCEGDLIVIDAGISGVDYVWQDGSTSPEMITTQSGTFTLQVSNACGEDIDTVNVALTPHVPDPDLGQDTSLCEGILLTLVSNATTQTLIKWQDGSSSPEFIVSSPGTYLLVHFNECGLETDSIVIDYKSLPVSIDLGPDTILCIGDYITLSAPATSDLITWQDGSHEPIMLVDQPQVYSLSIINECGIAEDVIHVAFDDCYVSDKIFIPNTFSPNDDGFNDVWVISPGSDVEIIKVSCMIFDRWGNLVFESNAMPVSWNAEFKGNALLPGVYAYRLELEYLIKNQRKSEVRFGDITLLR